MLRGEEVRRGPVGAAVIAWAIVAILLALPNVLGSLVKTFVIERVAATPLEAELIARPDKHRPDRHRPERERTQAKRSQPNRDDERKPSLGHTLPVPARLVASEELKQHHHDYPAIDIEIPRWRRVYSVTAGRVEKVVHRGACGNGVVVDGKDGYTYTYCHASRTAVRRGRVVKSGTPLMLSGSTGNSTGPHLHLQIEDPDGKLVCPQDLLPAWSRGRPRSPWKAHRYGCVSGSHKKPGRSHSKGLKQRR